jgi:serine/threonine protein kinase
VLQETERGYQMAQAGVQNPRWARTVEEGPTELPSWYNTRLHTPTIGAVQRTADSGRLAGYLFQLADFGLANQQQLANTFCGSPLYMAPDAVYRTHPQSPKMDVWSLFVVIGIVTQAGGLHDPKLASYEEVLPRVRAAAAQNILLSPMAQETPELRASAAQMLVKCFDGQGLSTPRTQVGPIPDSGIVLGSVQAPEQREPIPMLKTPNLKVVKPAAGDRKRINYAPPKLPPYRNIPRRDVYPKGMPGIERRGEFLGPRRFRDPQLNRRP